MSRYVDIDKPRYVRYKDERSGEVVTSEQTIAELLDGSIGLIDEEIVRCKDCKFKEGSCCDYSAVYVRPNGYCQWGERRQ